MRVHLQRLVLGRTGAQLVKQIALVLVEEHLFSLRPAGVVHDVGDGSLRASKLFIDV